MRSGLLKIAALSACLVLFGLGANAENGGKPGFAGSEACKECHNEAFEKWRLTPHAKMLVDTSKDPFAIYANSFTSEIPFQREDIAYTVGSHWVQKYLTRIDGTLYVLPKYWNIPKRDWEPYSIWNWRQNPYNIHCDGCHTVGFDPDTLSFFEPAVGCESCHGPGKAHVDGGGDTSKIVNPDKLDPDRKLMVCMQCHTDGLDTRRDRFINAEVTKAKKDLASKGVIGDEFKKQITAVKEEAKKKAVEKYPNEFKFPVDYVPGDDLADYYSDFFMPKPKSKRWYWGTMDFMERRRMYFFFQSKFYSTNRACEVCGFDRGKGDGANKPERYMDRNEYCGTCHKQRYEDFKGHSAHKPTDVLCTDCHNPSTTKDGTYSIHDHKFDFSKPKMACSECHDGSNPDDQAVESVTSSMTKWKPEPEHHDFHFQPVKFPKPKSKEEACLVCHDKKDTAWSKNMIRLMIDRGIK